MSTPPPKHSSKRSPAYFYSTAARWIPLCWPLLTKSVHSRPSPPSAPFKPSTASSAMLSGTQATSSCLSRAICSYAARVMHRTLARVKHDRVQEASSTSVSTSARNILTDLGYPQVTTTLICDNECAVGLATDGVKQKRSKAIDMRYHWIRDQVRQEKFKVKWEQGANNLADYFTKAHPVHHYVSMRRMYVHTPKPLVIRPCARSRRIEHRKHP
jgi:hypothetical protein